MTKPITKYPKLAHKPETKLKIAASLKGRKKTAITKGRMSEARFRYLARKAASAETKPVRQSHKPSTKRKIARSLKGRKKTDATKAKMRESRMRYLASLSTEGGQ